MNNELNINNFINFFNEIEEYDNNNYNYNYNSFKKIISKLLYHFFDLNNLGIINNYSMPNFDNSKEPLFYYRFDNIYIENSYIIEFKLMYPYNIVNLWENDILKFNIDEFGILYSFMVKNYDVIINNLINKKLFKCIIVSTYGYTVSVSTSFIYTNKIDFKSNINKIYSLLIQCYDDYLIFYDTDIISFDFINQEIIDLIDKLNIPYRLISNNKVFLNSKKRYIIIDKDNNIHKSGYKTFESKFTLEKNRLNKIKNIKNKLMIM